ncbi:MAG: CDP-alcohol phosphatidyltransferase family protein [Candidatus Hydrothermarchaeota archaeon]
MLSARLRGSSDRIVLPLARVLAKVASPNAVTAFGLVCSLLATLAFASGALPMAFLFLFLAALADLLDGAVAKASGRVTELGGFLDSVTDRYSDSLILLGLMLYLERYYLLIFMVLTGSLLVSYTRARGELLIPRCEVGVAERAERLLILLVATLLAALGVRGMDPFLWALVLLAILTHLTVLQRVLFTRSSLGP